MKGFKAKLGFDVAFIFFISQLILIYATSDYVTVVLILKSRV